MDINRNNYEAFLLDLAEGRLNAKEIQQVRDFLQLNPDCGEGLDREQYWRLKSEWVGFPGKQGLRKEFPSHTSELSDSDFGLFSIARLEGDLNREQELAYARMVEGDKDKYQEWLAWKQTKLMGGAIVYEGKDRLKKKPERSPAWVWISIVSAAAAVAVIIALVRIGPGTSEPVIPEPELTSTSVSTLEILCQDLQSDLNKYKRIMDSLKVENKELRKALEQGGVSPDIKELTDLRNENISLKAKETFTLFGQSKR